MTPAPPARGTSRPAGPAPAPFASPAAGAPAPDLRRGLGDRATGARGVSNRGVSNRGVSNRGVSNQGGGDRGVGNHDVGNHDAGTLRRVVVACAVFAAVIHTLAVVWTWLEWSPGLSGGWLVWLDLPVSLLYLHRVGVSLLPWSLALGGAQWAATGALLAWAVGRAAGRRTALRRA